MRSSIGSRTGNRSGKQSSDSKRRMRVAGKKLQPKKVGLSGRFCKYGRVHSGRSRGSTLSAAPTFIVSIGGNQNNNWRV